MNVLAPVKTLMTTNLITVNPGDKLIDVKAIFEKNKIHHIPVVSYKKIVGIVSKTDFIYFMRGFSRNEEDQFVNEARLRAYKAEDIMTKGLAKLTPDQRINVALEIFLENRFHAIPVVEEQSGELIGIITTFDVIKALASEEVTAKQILDSKKA
ncbi:MAG: CBS domain-containing protein [Lewinellaceae bacterium]|nr:CBS domain-containing protein [Phaeodactylibacter sp.]MCB0615541.1 CBS domain-containing protein [Phaeodactylibacter sp.]MCB9347779.1 CBS domain-containing protein [Lewinellaceae bacterium]